VYPLPDPGGGLGVHFTLDLAGAGRFGPDTEPLPPETSPDDVDYSVDPGKAAVFEAAVRRYWPDLPEGSLVPGYAGVRTKVLDPGSGKNSNESSPSRGSSMGEADFLVWGSEGHGTNGMVHMLGIESPGLTASLALAEDAAGKALGQMG
jgi:L-2-hydroxyglutarate oxidase LhgO